MGNLMRCISWGQVSPIFPARGVKQFGQGQSVWAREQNHCMPGQNYPIAGGFSYGLEIQL